MPKKIIFTDKAPAAIGPYSQAIQMGEFIFISGQIPIDPSTNELVAGDIEAQAHQVLKNIQAILFAQNLRMGNIIKTSIFLTDMNVFPTVNKVYAQYFQANFPARETIAVMGLPKAASIEISAIAHI